MFIDFIMDIFSKNNERDAIIWKNKTYNYKWLINTISKYNQTLKLWGINKGNVVALTGDFSPNIIAVLFSLIDNACIIVPFSDNSEDDNLNKYNISQVEHLLTCDDNDKIIAKRISLKSDNKYYKVLRKKAHPGLVLFTSGSSGEPKAAVHDLLKLLEKFKTRRKTLRALNFLMFDHWGGLNTMFHILSNGGTIITTKDRSPINICKLIEVYKIELLPTSPTFLNLLLLSRAYEYNNLECLKIISYGTEPMPKNTLRRLKFVFPKVKLLQTYGLIELGVMKSISENNNSVWIKIGGDGYSTRIIDGILQIKAKSAMMGYLNAENPFTEDGWFITGDEVLQKGDYIKILGRKSEIINVGGEKVYPSEVENVVLEMENVVEVTVYGEKNPIIGNIICARVRLQNQRDNKNFTNELKNFCSSKLQNYKIPVKVTIDNNQQYNARFKKLRKTYSK